MSGRWRSRLWAGTGAVALLLVAGGACTLPPIDRPDQADRGTAGPTRGAGIEAGAVEPAASPADLLEQLVVADPSLGGYERDLYGSWADLDGDGCNTRDEVLARDAVPGTVRTTRSGGCSQDVIAGTWSDPYTGARLEFDDLKDPSQAQQIPIDHVVALAEAHRSGAHAWSTHEREAFANDEGNLVAASVETNSDKSDHDPARWMPPARGAGCWYAAAWVRTKARWQLSVDVDERDALRVALLGC